MLKIVLKEAKMRRGTFRFILAIMAFVFLLIPVTGSSADKTIQLGASFNMTGHYENTEMCMGYKNYLEYINDQGGISGLKTNLMWTDDAGETNRGLAMYRRAKDAEALCFFVSTTGLGMALKKRAAKDGIPLVSMVVTDMVLETPPQWLYNMHATFCTQANTALTYIEKTWDKAAKGRLPKIGFLVWENPIGTAPIPYCQKFALDRGWGVGPTLTFGFTTLVFKSQLKALNDAKCDYVFSFFSGSQLLPITQENFRLGSNKDMIMVYPDAVYPMWGVIEPLDRNQTDGILFVNVMCMPDEDVPGVPFVRSLMEKYRGAVVKTSGEWDQYCYGVQYGIIVTEAIKRAIAAVGPDKLTGEAFKKFGLDTISDLDTKGVTMGVSFTDYEFDRVACKGARILKMENRKPVPVTPWMKFTYKGGEYKGK